MPPTSAARGKYRGENPLMKWIFKLSSEIDMCNVYVRLVWYGMSGMVWHIRTYACMHACMYLHMTMYKSIKTTVYKIGYLCVNTLQTHQEHWLWVTEHSTKGC
jgi:hypothetical protein